jgi:hypothetical protein
MRIMAKITPTTRRTAIATMAGAALTAAVPASAGAPFNPVPTRLGRRYLFCVEQIRFLWAHMPREGTPAYDACQERCDRHHGELEALKAEIVARPVLSVSDMVDRLIVVGHEVGWIDENFQEEIWPALGGTLVAAGLNPSECCEEHRPWVNDLVEA